MSEKKIKDTKLGSWLKDKAPNVLSVVGNLLPDSGGLGVVKNLIAKDPDVDTNEGTAAVDAEIAFQLIRPVTLIALMSMFMVTMMIDSMDNVAFTVKDSYVDLLQVLMLTAFGAYFAGRTIEKAKK